jgi:hypothetical protein
MASAWRTRGSNPPRRPCKRSLRPARSPCGRLHQISMSAHTVPVGTPDTGAAALPIHGGRGLLDRVAEPMGLHAAANRPLVSCDLADFQAQLYRCLPEGREVRDTFVAETGFEPVISGLWALRDGPSFSTPRRSMVPPIAGWRKHFNAADPGGLEPPTVSLTGSRSAD